MAYFQDISNVVFCIHCQDTRKVLGHSTIDCPNVICNKCSTKGHNGADCAISNSALTFLSLEKMMTDVQAKQKEGKNITGCLVTGCLTTEWAFYFDHGDDTIGK